MADPEARAEAQFQKALVLEDAGRLDEALAAFAEVGKDVPGVPASPYARLGSARVLGKLGRMDEAVAAFEAERTVFPEFAPALLDLGVAQLRTEEWMDALRMFEMAGRLEPMDPDPELLSAVTMAYRRRFPEAMQAYGRAWERQQSVIDFLKRGTYYGGREEARRDLGRGRIPDLGTANLGER